MTQKEYLNELLSIAGDIPELIRSKFSDYTTEQLNWKPDSSSWSIGEIFEHIIQTNSQYYSHLDEKIKITNGINTGDLPVKHTFVGKIILKAVSPGGRKTKTFKVFEPAVSNVDNNIYARFLEQHEKLIQLIKKSAAVDINRIKISSPVSSLIRYNLADVLGILVYHTQRHLNQVERTAVMFNSKR